MGKKKTGRTMELPVIPLRGITVFPVMSFSFDIGREKSARALEEASTSEQLVFLVSQKDPKVEEPELADLYSVGVIVEVKQMLRLSGEMIRALGEGVKKARLVEFTQKEPFLAAVIEEMEETAADSSEFAEALLRTAAEQYEEYARLSMNQPPDSIYSVITETDLNTACDLIASNITLRFEQKQELLEMADLYEKAKTIIETLERENNVLEIQKGIYSKVRSNVDKNQKDYYLKEQLKVIRKELGDAEEQSEAEVYREKLTALSLPKDSHEKLMKDVNRLAKMQTSSSDYSVLCGYFDTILELPWNTKTKEHADVAKARKQLEKDHFGMEKVKERIIEYIAVRANTGKADVPILCFAGPPGTGKTSIVKSIAAALNRKYFRMSLGGVRDEADIRGHRKTYVGAMPGRILYAIAQAKSSNPLILLDEIDKLSSDHKGDPSSALLEVLDMEQNFAFRDHYLEIPFDLSDTVFICTANRTDTIAPALRDRMEIIEVPGYTEDEKINIAKNFLYPKQLKKNGLTKRQLKIKENTYSDIINSYTKESGVRQLERHIGKICRKAVLELVGGAKTVTASKDNLETFLGIPRYRKDRMLEKPTVGVAKGLAWTGYGGDTLSIEVNTMKGSGKFELTGNMGDVMKESAKAAISYIRSNAGKYKIDERFYKNTDIHIHIPEGAVPKDGPSAGITMAAAMISALTDTAVANNVAMTGEITIRGNVLPVGGLREKLLAAKRGGIEKIAAPRDNKKDIEEIPAEVRSGLDISYVEYMDEVLEKVLVKDGKDK